MSSEHVGDVTDFVIDLVSRLNENDLAATSDALAAAPREQVTSALERLSSRQRAVAYRLLSKYVALEVFEDLPPRLRGDLVQSLRDTEVVSIFAELDPDDRVWLLDELPAQVAPRLLRGLTERERALTAEVLGYPRKSIGRRMSPEYVSVRATLTVEQAMERVRGRLDDAETIYTLPVVDDGRRVVGVVGLRSLLRAEPDTLISDLMREAQIASARDDAETAARRCADQGLIALPIVDDERRLVGILTIDDAVRILEREESEDVARQGGVEPLHTPYLATPIQRIVRSRIVWLLVLAVGATLTVHVLSTFESTLEEVTVLALFVPLLIGTGGNTGSQAATTVTRALALEDVRPSDLARVLSRELRVGLSLGALLGAGGFLIASPFYGMKIGLVVGSTLVVICAVAAGVGGMMPLLARAIGVDPAVFSNPFITTFVDATGLVIYFLIARAVLQI